LEFCVRFGPPLCQTHPEIFKMDLEMLWVNKFFIFGQYSLFFLTCPCKGRGKGIQTCEVRFIRRDSQLIELPLGDGQYSLIN
jgi:hypothetical protein